MFNAAQTGAMLSNVNNEEYKYLFEQVSKVSGISNRCIVIIIIINVE